MIHALLLIAAQAAQPSAPPPEPVSESERLLAEAGHALRQGRLTQARTMTAMAVGKGADPKAVDRLNADIAFVKREDTRALALYRGLLAVSPDDPALLERGGISALRIGKMDEAEAMLARASALVPDRWPVLNALGVIADRRGDFARAEAYYQRALALAPDEPKLLNNHGWSLILQGRWEEALMPLSRAVGLDPEDKLAAANLDLARMALAAELPGRRQGESEEAYAARLNDAGVAAAARGERTRAIAAFTRAIEESNQWYERAARNLASLEGKE